jgi:pimeloyl-ACP methyl ester carboxylesterase
MMDQSRKPHLVLVPGLLCTRALFAAQVEALRTIADITVSEETRNASLVESARQILAAAPPRFSLGGLSMGGYIAFEILRQAPEHVVKLALIDTNARADRPEQVKQRRDLVRLAEREGLGKVMDVLLPNLVHSQRLTDDVLVSSVRRMAEEVGLEAFRRQQEAIIGRPDNRPFLVSMRCPTVIIVGEHDMLTPVKVAEEMAAGIAGSRLEIIPECGHLTTLERPERVNHILADWLNWPTADAR